MINLVPDDLNLGSLCKIFQSVGGSPGDCAVRAGVPDGIHISGATHRFVAQDPQFKWREVIVDVKGKGTGASRFSSVHSWVSWPSSVPIHNVASADKLLPMCAV